ncbi:MAG: hypothetical protein Phyf2KO_20460 [Phycisphaerales bacterium]
MFKEAAANAILLKPRITLGPNGDFALTDDESSDEKQRLLFSLHLTFDNVDDYSASNLMPFIGGPGRGNMVFFSGYFSQKYSQQSVIENLIRKLVSQSNNFPIFPLDPKLGTIVLENETASPSKTLAALAASGIHTAMPNIGSNHLELAVELKSKFNDERIKYLHYFEDHISAAHKATSEGCYKDAWEYAMYETGPALSKALHDYTKAIQNSDKKLLKNIALGTWQEAPAMCSTLGSGIPMATLPVLFKIFVSSFSTSQREKLAEYGLPHASYLYKIQKLSK